MQCGDSLIWGGGGKCAFLCFAMVLLLLFWGVCVRGGCWFFVWVGFGVGGFLFVCFVKAKQFTYFDRNRVDSFQ